jgi:hypothetical protein
MTYGRLEVLGCDCVQSLAISGAATRNAGHMQRQGPGGRRACRSRSKRRTQHKIRTGSHAANMSALSASQAIHVSPQQLNRPQHVPPHALVRKTPTGISTATPTTDTMTACARARVQCRLA